MKKSFLVIALFVLSLCAFAQKKTNKYLVDEFGNPNHYSVFAPWSKCNILLLVDGGTKRIDPFINLGELSNLVYLEGTKQIELESRIHKDSLKYYRYSIIENDTNYLVKDAIPKKIKFEWPDGSDHPGYLTLDLGVYNNFDKKFTVQMYYTKENRKINTVVIYNKKIVPAVISYVSVFTDKSYNYIGNAFKSGDTIKNDSSTKYVMVVIENNDLSFAYDIDLISKELMRGVSGKWKYVGKGMVGFEIDAKYFKKPGDYEIKIQPKLGYDLQKNIGRYQLNISKFRFVVAKGDEKTFKTREVIILGIVTAAIFGAILAASLAFLKKKNQQKLFFSQQQKDIIKMQLNSIRSQLNPHFMFNALAGIQNLMNKNKTDEANTYLGKFARLTRNVLDQKEMVSLAEEKELLTDYLQMEQFRFGFAYEIELAETIDLNIEIPSMLLQPFVENAIKHGIASKLDKGHVKVSFATQNKDLILSIKDNGTGFDTSQLYEGLGLQLSKNRISLLNSIYTTTPFLLNMNSNENGTEIIITLTQWL